MKISGFSFIHNAIHAGIPIVESIASVSNFVDEMVVVDLQSTDDTRKTLERLGCIIVDGYWIPGGGDHNCLDVAFDLHNDWCKYDTILSFDADEVWSYELLNKIMIRLRISGCFNMAVARIQVEQNFQRIRMYPYYVHRIMNRGICKRIGQTTTMDHIAIKMPIDDGYLWDCSNNYRDNWLNRVLQNAELYGGEPNYMMVPYHFGMPVRLTEEEAVKCLHEPHWEWKSSPLNLPAVIKKQVGVTRYIGI